jgi:RNA polymerase sigma-70 factor (ECF subfamily)
MGDSQTDLELVQRVQQGDKNAFDVLVRRYQHRIAAVIGRYIHDPAEVQDVAQETFLRAWRALGQFRADSQFYTWLFRIAVNAAKNHLVSSGRRPPTEDIEPGEAELFAGAHRLHDNDTPERVLLREELQQTVAETADALPPELREALTLREVDGLSYEEIAQRMDCPIGTVRSRIFRAREAIDARLRPLLDRDRVRP